MFRKLFTALLLFLFFSSTFGQSLFVGRVIDSENKKPLKEVSVSVEGSDQKVVTNHLGYFQIAADTSNFIVFERLFYKSGKIKVPANPRILVSLEKRTEPEYDEGIAALYSYLSKNVKYPLQARRMGVQGCVYVSFQIDSLGAMHDVVVLEDQVGECGTQLTELLLSAPGKWEPAEKNVAFTLPVKFRLGEVRIICKQPPLLQGIVLREFTITAIGVR